MTDESVRDKARRLLAARGPTSLYEFTHEAPGLVAALLSELDQKEWKNERLGEAFERAEAAEARVQELEASLRGAIEHLEMCDDRDDNLMAQSLRAALESPSSQRSETP